MDKTDAKLKTLEKQIKSVYSKAYQEMKKEASDILAKIEMNPNMSLAQKLALMNQYNRLDNLTKQLANSISNANSVAQKMINNEMVNVYELNYNGDAERLGFSLVDHGAVKKILKEEENPFNLVSGLHDKVGIRNQMKGQLMSGLLKGESIPKIAKRLKDVSEKSLKDSIRIARTETTRVQNSAKMDIGKHGQELGFEMWKRWVATTDGRVREDHLAMNGVEVPQDEPFVLPDGSKMMFPGDISLGANAGQVINCRCTVVEFIKRNENGNFVMKEDEGENTKKQVQEKVVQKVEEAEAKRPLTDDEASAVEYYVSGDGMYINDYLRGRHLDELGEMGEEEKELISDLDKATDKLIEPQILYRSVDASAVFGDLSQIEYENLREQILYGGDTFGKGKFGDSIRLKNESFLSSIEDKIITDKGFMSTTTDYEVASYFGDFTGSTKPIVLELVTGENTRGISLREFLPELNEKMEQEEVLLHRNTSYKILSVESKDGNIYVKAKIQ